jgi:SAM-dependent methyltransferase
MEADHWSGVAADWARLWGGLAAPVWDVLLAAAAAGPGTRVLDVGCGGGDLLAHLDRLGIPAAGADPAPGMVAYARDRLPGTDIRLAGAEHLPWPDAVFELVTAVNAVQFAEDTLDALAEMARVVVPGGLVAVANWAEGGRNDLDTIEAAVARADGEEPPPDGDLRTPGGLEELLSDGGLTVAAAGIVRVDWHASDDDTLVRGVLLGADEATRAETAATVIAAARPFRRADHTYTLTNHFRYALGRTGSSRT